MNFPQDCWDLIVEYLGFVSNIRRMYSMNLDKIEYIEANTRDSDLFFLEHLMYQMNWDFKRWYLQTMLHRDLYMHHVQKLVQQQPSNLDFFEFPPWSNFTKFIRVADSRY